MNPTILEALIAAGSAILATIATLFIQSRRLPSDIKLTEANAEKTQHETATMVINNLREEVSRLKGKIVEFEDRLTKAEARATKAETRATAAEERLADAEVRAYKFRRDVIEIGERLDAEKAKFRDMIIRLVSIVDSLLDCIEHPDKINSIDRPAITKLIQSMLDGYPAEKVIGVSR